MNWFETWFDTPYYHILYNNRDQKEAETFILNLVEYFNIKPPCNILDLACGKGRHSIFLNSLGFNVIGIDLSNESIEFANKFANKNLNFFVNDMRHFDLDQNFDLIINLFTSFGYFEDFNDNIQVFKNVSNHLLPNKYFIIDFLNSIFIQNNLKSNETVIKKGIEFHITKEIIDKKLIKTIKFFDNNKEFEFQEKLSLLTLEDFESYAKKTGFKLESILGDYSLSPFDLESSERQIMIFQKL